MKDSEEIKTIVNKYKWNSIHHGNIVFWHLKRIRDVGDYKFSIDIKGHRYNWEVHVLIDRNKQYDLVDKLHDEGRDIEDVLEKAERFLSEKGKVLLGKPLSLEPRDTPVSPLEKIRWHNYWIDHYTEDRPSMEFDCTWEESASIGIYRENDSWIEREWYRGTVNSTSFQDEDEVSTYVRERLDFTRNKDLQKAMTF